MRALTQTTIIEALTDEKLFAPLFRGWFKDAKSWSRWHVFLRALFGLPMSAADLEVLKQCTGLDAPPDCGADEGWLICGRRSGKSRTVAVTAAYLATMVDWSPYLSGGERGVVMVLASNRRQAQVIFKYIREFLQIKILAPLIERETQESIDLRNGISIEVMPASYRTTRGFTIVAALCDELAFWMNDENGANPDKQILGALRPAMATVPSSKLLVASSPYAKKGELWDTFQRYYGKAGDVLVWKAPSKFMNPTIPQRVIDKAYAKDPADAAAEYGAEFRSDLSSWLDLALIEAAVDHGITVRPPIPGVSYRAFCDPSGGAKDSFTAAVGHAEGNIAVLDCLIEIRAPFNPDEAVAQIADVLKSYGVARVTSDRYAAAWPLAAFARHGIKLEHSDRDRSAIYLDCLPLFTTGCTRLIESDRLVAQFAGLVRTTSPGGRDKVDHGKTGVDDLCNSAAGVLSLVAARSERRGAIAVGVDTFGSRGSGGGVVSAGRYISYAQQLAERPPPPPDHLDFVWNEEEGRWARPQIDPRSR
jgi:Terminase large subunit, T4likevirus-type, N-terminal